MQPLSGNQRPDLLTALMNMSLVLRLPRKMHLSRSYSNVPRLPSFLEMLQNPHVLLTFEKVHNPLRLPRETTSEPPKVVRTPGVFNIFDFEMCCAPQQRAFFRHLNFQKWSEHGVFCTFWLRNVLRATTACTFSTSQLPKVVPIWCVLYILTSKCASHHNTLFRHRNFQKWSEPVVFCAFCLRNVLRATTACTFRHRNFQKWSGAGVLCTCWLRNLLRATTACNFSSLIWRAGSAPAALASLLFDPPEPQIIGKTQCFGTFLPFRAPGSSFFWHFLFSDLLSSTLLFSLTLPVSAFHLSILSEVWLLNFLR